MRPSTEAVDRVRDGLRAATTLLVLAGLGCASPHGTPSESSAVAGIPVDAVELPTEELLSFGPSGIADSRRIVIRSASEWGRFWDEAHGSIVPRPEPPEVDFSRSMVLAAAMGGRRTGGYSISIPSVRHEGSEVYAVVRAVSPGPTCFTTQAFTAPVVAIRVPLLEGPVRWLDDEVQREC